MGRRRLVGEMEWSEMVATVAEAKKESLCFDVLTCVD